MPDRRVPGAGLDPQRSAIGAVWGSVWPMTVPERVLALFVGLLAFLQDTRVAGDARPRSATSRALRAFEWLGLVSYGVYLFNVPVASVIERATPLGGNARSFAVVAATLLVSTLAYYAIERPFMRLRTWPLEQQRELGSV